MILAPMTLSAVPSASALLGTAGNAELMQSINQNLGLNTQFFGSVHDVFASGRRAFVQNIVEPLRQVGHQIKNTANKLLRNDVIMALTKPEDFEYVPPSMHIPILMYEPVRQMHKQGRLYGFGYDPDNMPTEDVYGRLINNGTLDIDAATMPKEPMFEWTWDTDDPEVTFEELSYVEQTRHAIDAMLEKREIDPTDYPNPIA